MNGAHFTMPPAVSAAQRGAPGTRRMPASGPSRQDLHGDSGGRRSRTASLGKTLPDSEVNSRHLCRRSGQSPKPAPRQIGLHSGKAPHASMVNSRHPFRRSGQSPEPAPRQVGLHLGKAPYASMVNLKHAFRRSGQSPEPAPRQIGLHLGKAPHASMVNSRHAFRRSGQSPEPAPRQIGLHSGKAPPCLHGEFPECAASPSRRTSACGARGTDVRPGWR
jgi:hypothetical protein